MELFGVERLPSYSTIRRTLLAIDYKQYSARLARFFKIKPIAGEILALDGKNLRGSYMVENDNLHCEPHKAILEPIEVDNKSNKITAIPEVIIKRSIFSISSNAILSQLSFISPI